jgi:hypothetical protein
MGSSLTDQAIAHCYRLRQDKAAIHYGAFRLTTRENRDTTGFRGENGGVPVFQKGERRSVVARKETH